MTARPQQLISCGAVCCLLPEGGNDRAFNGLIRNRAESLVMTGSRASHHAGLFTEDHYRTMFESIDQGFCTIEVLVDEDGEPFDYRFLDVNRAFEQQTGLRDAVGRRMRELAPAHEEHWFKIYGDVALSGKAVRFEQAAAALGRWYDVYAFQVDEPTRRHVAILFNDITARKQAEQALHASEARYRALAHAAAKSLYRLSADGTRLIEVYGGSIARHIEPGDTSTSWLDDYVHPDDRERVRNTWLAAVASGTVFELELRGRFAGGSWGWVLSRAVPVRNDAGVIVEWIGSATDITERKEAEHALRRSEANHDAARREAERANRAKDEFLAMLGHELRNPLAPMLTALQLMRLRGRESREQEILERQVKHLTRMVDDLLDVSRITRGKIELQKRPVELSDVVIRALEIAGPMLEQRQAFVDVQVPRHGVGINADRERMAQVLSNLLTNAAKYSDHGSRIIVKGQRDGEVVRVSVQDEGIGIAPEMLGSVFDAFVQQSQSLERAVGGLGLGLAIVRSLVTAHGGRVRAESEGVNRGAEFIVELPAIDVAGAAADHGLRSQPSRAIDGATQRILVVDDNEDAADMLRAALEQLGHVVEIALDGPSALARAEAFRPDTVLLDIGLPVMNGYEVAQRLRSIRQGANAVRLIAVTGYGQEADRERAVEAGFDYHLVKPIDLHQLERLIEESTPQPRRPVAAD
jgi:PAS domain S-box-containing protein